MSLDKAIQHGKEKRKPYVQVFRNCAAVMYELVYDFKFLRKCEEGSEREFFGDFNYALKIRFIHEISSGVPTEV